MIRSCVAVAFGVAILFANSASADECGPGCHHALNGACTVDGWDQGAPVRNECPAGARPRPPCGNGFVWSRRSQACVLR